MKSRYQPAGDAQHRASTAGRRARGQPRMAWSRPRRRHRGSVSGPAHRHHHALDARLAAVQLLHHAGLIKRPPRRSNSRAAVSHIWPGPYWVQKALNQRGIAGLVGLAGDPAAGARFGRAADGQVLDALGAPVRADFAAGNAPDQCSRRTAGSPRKFPACVPGSMGSITR